MRANDRHRVTFKWENGHADEVPVEDYHQESELVGPERSRPARSCWRNIWSRSGLVRSRLLVHWTSR